MVDGVWLQHNARELIFLAGLLAVAWGGSWILHAVLSSRLDRLRAARGRFLHLEVLRAFVPLLRWGLLLAALAVVLDLLALPAPTDRLLGRFLQGAFTLLAALIASRAVSVALRHWAEVPGDHAQSRTRATIGPVLARVCQIFLVLIAALLVLQNSGYNVAGLLAGLGIGGLAVALAAKETLANLFGSLAILMDRTFEVGDTIRQGRITGVVENIGLRSTRLRTEEGHIVSIPNQIITSAPLINMGPGQHPASSSP